MNLTNAAPSPRSNKVRDSRKTLKRTHTPNSPGVRWRHMNGVSRIVAAKLQNRPRKLKNVLTMSFREKLPRKVIGRLFRSDWVSHDVQWRASGFSDPLASGQASQPVHSPPIERIHDSRGRSDIESPNSNADRGPD